MTKTNNEIVNQVELTMQDERVIKWLAENIGERPNPEISTLGGPKLELDPLGGLVKNTLAVTQGGVKDIVTGVVGKAAGKASPSTQTLKI